MIRIILSWIPGLRDSGFGRIIYELTEPILGPIRNMIDNSPIGGGMMLDFSPVIALFIMKVISVILQSVVSSIL
jgi:YggT family protein